MVGCAYYNGMARQTVKLYKQRTNYPFDFSRFLRIAPVLSNRVKFIEKQHAWISRDKINQAAKTVSSFT